MICSEAQYIVCKVTNHLFMIRIICTELEAALVCADRGVSGRHAAPASQAGLLRVAGGVHCQFSY